MLRGDETDLLWFFGVEPKFDEFYHSFSYEIAKDGLRLVFTLFDLDGTVYVSLFRDGLPLDLFTVRRDLCTHVQVRTDTPSFDYLEAGAPAYPVSDPGMKPVLVRGLRVFVEPQFRVEFIDDRNS